MFVTQFWDRSLINNKTKMAFDSCVAPFNNSDDGIGTIWYF